MNTLTSILPLLAVAASLAYLFKKPHRTSNFSMSMLIALLAFGLCAYFGKDMSEPENSLFGISFAILCLYCITIVPLIMHLSSAIRQRKKMALKELAEKANEQN